MRNESSWINRINFLTVTHCEITHCGGKYLRRHFLRNQLHLRELTCVIYFPARVSFASCSCIATVRECNLAEWYCSIRDADAPHGTARDTHEWELKASRPYVKRYAGLTRRTPRLEWQIPDTDIVTLLSPFFKFLSCSFFLISASHCHVKRFYTIFT